MKIVDATTMDKDTWNLFVEANYPPVGAFMQSWEWGEFQEAIGRKIGRYAVKDDGETVAVFTLVHYSLPFGFEYGYIPRGPVLLGGQESDVVAIFTAIKDWIKRAYPKFVFVRMEPPFESFDAPILGKGFHISSYYVQPRFNASVPLSGSGDLLAQFHPSTRSNIHRAEKRGVRAELKTQMSDAEYETFMIMMRETAARNGAKNIYPDDTYLKSLITGLPSIETEHDPAKLSIGIFYGYHNDELAAINLVLFFGGTATYLFGASHSKHLNSKITTYLHTFGMQEAQKRGYAYYDLGGIDPVRWPSLTDFKRQFRGDEFEYIGNINIPLRPVWYAIYNSIRSRK